MALVRYNGKNIYSCEGVTLLPGINKIEGGKLESVLKNPFFLLRVEKGIIVIIKEYKRPKLENRQLVELMPEIYDVKLLKKYIETNEDEEVVESAKKQLEIISNVATMD